jgi:hypothetical protein
MIRRARIRKTGTSIVNASFRLHLYNSAPTPSSGDNGAWLTSGAADYIGAIDITLDRAFTDGAAGNGVPVTGGEHIIKPASGTTIFGLLEARAAYVPRTPSSSPCRSRFCRTDDWGAPGGDTCAEGDLAVAGGGGLHLAARWSVAGSGRLRLPSSTRTVNSGSGATGGHVSRALHEPRSRFRAGLRDDRLALRLRHLLGREQCRDDDDGGEVDHPAVVLLRFSTNAGRAGRRGSSATARRGGHRRCCVRQHGALLDQPTHPGDGSANALLEVRLVTKQPFGATYPHHTLGIPTNFVPGSPRSTRPSMP